LLGAAAEAGVKAMHTSAVDALLSRVLFVVVGTTMGLMGAQSLIFLLRSWHLWDAPPITAALSSLGGAWVFGRLWLFVGGVVVLRSGFNTSSTLPPFTGYRLYRAGVRGRMQELF
jgi:hypothetical protein